MNKKFILILVVILIIIAGGVFYFWYKQQPPQMNIPTTPPTIKPLSGNMSCEEMYDEIENDIDNANYCKTDSDCDVLMLVGRYMEFGCYRFVNKGVDKDQFYKKIDTYYQKCSQILNECAPVSDTRCVSNKCVRIGQE